MTTTVRDYASAARQLEADGWATWVAGVLPNYATHPFAPHHAELWEWAWAVEPGVRADPFVAVWARGAAKSTTAEAAVAAWTCRRRRRYVLYVCGTQDKADDHVQNIAAMLESPTVAALYPDAASRALNLYGSSKGWRRNRLRTRSGMTVDALGLDTAARGAKVEDARPDAIILDDLDDVLDTEATTAKKIALVTKSILPAGAGDVVVLGVQNVILDSGIFARLAGVSSEPADFLQRRRVSGPISAVENLVTKQVDGKTVIVGGRATWEGMDLVDCQAMIDDEGITAFLSERQHATEPPPGGMFDDVDFDRLEVVPGQHPRMEDVAVWVDPAVTDKEESDCQGIAVMGRAAGKAWLLHAHERRGSPVATLRTAVRLAVEHGAAYVGVETDQGGDTWGSVFREAVADVATGADGLGRLPEARHLTMRSAKAGQTQLPKVVRAQRVLLSKGFEKDRIRLVLGTAHVARKALRRFPKTKPLDLVDCMVWAFGDMFPEAWVSGQDSYRDERARR